MNRYFGRLVASLSILAPALVSLPAQAHVVPSVAPAARAAPLAPSFAALSAPAPASSGASKFSEDPVFFPELPFGDEWCGTAVCGAPQPGQPRRFTGKERDTETGFDYFGARYYRARIGRFTTVDPVMNIKASLVDPQRWNRYSYGLNNPYRYVDPDGRAVETLWDIGNLGLGVASLGANLSDRNIVGAAVDVFGLAIDLAATAVPGVPGGAGAVIKAARAADKAADARTFITYTIRSADETVLYVGRASGPGNPLQVLKKRASSHKYRDAGRFKLEDVQHSKAANRGAEDVMFNRERLAAQAEGRTLLNTTNPISPRNSRGRSYVDEFVRE